MITEPLSKTSFVLFLSLETATISKMSSLQNFTQTCRKIVAVGRNYKAHVAELGNSLPSKPMLFMKPPTSFITQGQPIEIPLGCSDLHHEIELGVLINSKCSRVSQADSMNYVGGYALVLDMTARDFQKEAKDKGHPWEMAKGFDTSCPVGDFIPKSSIQDPHQIQLICKVNGELRQDGNTGDMIFNIPTLISYISNYFTLEEGDLILTGTPAGVGPVKEGDEITGEIPNLQKFKFSVVKRT